MKQGSMNLSLAAGAGRKFCQKAVFSVHSIFAFQIPGDVNHGVVLQSGSCEPNLDYTIRPRSEVYVSPLTLILYKSSNQCYFLV